ncbi:hypothetical protein I5168_11960 [Nonlabens sp. SCSIO 43208]|uniref:hypothetical protein n=1 Tax=Nonlabens sp. SCSIO 43208 TaxID=2793009 RepID=UPI003D6A84D8
MNIQEIKKLAKQSADNNEIDSSKDEWHSHYYGFIFGMQEAFKVIQCGVNKDIDNHPIEGVNEFMSTDIDSE